MTIRMARYSAVRSFCAMILLGTLCNASPICADPPLTPETKRFLAAQDSLAERKIGVMLQATASLGKHNSEPAIHIKWTIDFEGPRQPLIILRPELNSTTSGQTVVRCFAVNKTGALHRFEIKAPNLPGLPGPGKDWMLMLKKGEKATGTVTLPIKDVRNEFKQQCGADLDDISAFHVQLWHKPTERMLDGWTGELYTKVLLAPTASTDKD